MAEIFDPKIGIIAKGEESSRNVSADKEAAEKIIKELKEPMFIEDLIKLVQKTCALTNDEVYEIVVKISNELNPLPKPITE